MIEKGMEGAKNLAEKGKSTIEKTKHEKSQEQEIPEAQNQITVEVGQDPSLEYDKEQISKQIEELKLSIEKINDKINKIGEGW